MLLLIAVPLALALGLLLGGRIEKLALVNFRFGWLALVAFVLQWALVHLAGTDPNPWLGLGLTGSAAILLGVVLINLRLPGFKLLFLAFLLNLLVMLANGGFMPITPSSIQAIGEVPPAISYGERIPLSKNILVTDEQARLGFLGDSLVLTQPVRFVVSPGDALLALGVAWFVVAALEPRQRRLAVSV